MRQRILLGGGSRHLYGLPGGQRHNNSQRREMTTHTGQLALTFPSARLAVALLQGSYCSTTGSTACPAGHYCPGQSASPVACPAGTASGATSATSSSTCGSCPAGKFAPAGSSACSSCAAGSYAPNAGSASCSACPAGSYCPAGSSAATDCPAGTYNSGAGAGSAASCAACPAVSGNRRTRVRSAARAGGRLVRWRSACLSCHVPPFFLVCTGLLLSRRL